MSDASTSDPAKSPMSCVTVVQGGLAKWQAFLESKIPQLKTIPTGKYAAVASLVALLLTVIVIVGGIAVALGSRDSGDIFEKNFKARNCPPVEVFDAIWDGFYGVGKRKSMYSVTGRGVGSDYDYAAEFDISDYGRKVNYITFNKKTEAKSIKRFALVNDNSQIQKGYWSKSALGVTENSQVVSNIDKVSHLVKLPEGKEQMVAIPLPDGTFRFVDPKEPEKAFPMPKETEQAIRKLFAKELDGTHTTEIEVCLSVKDKSYLQWKQQARQLMGQLQVGEEEAASHSWLAGRWFALDEKTTKQLESWKKSRAVKRICDLEILIKIIGYDDKLLATKRVPLKDIRRKDGGDEYAYPLWHRPDDVFALGRLADFCDEDRNDDQIWVNKTVDGKTYRFLEVSKRTAESMAYAEPNDTKPMTVFKFPGGKVVDVLKRELVIDLGYESKFGRVVCVYTPLAVLYKEDDVFPEGYVAFFKSESFGGERQSRFIHVFASDRLDAYHSSTKYDWGKDESLTAKIKFEDFEFPVYGNAIERIECCIEEAGK